MNIKTGTEPAGTPHVFEDLFAGNYRVVATDSEGCSVTEEYGGRSCQSAHHNLEW